MNRDIKNTLGLELLCEAGAALLDSTAVLAEYISPEEAAELEKLQQSVSTSDKKATIGYMNTNEEIATIAAETEIRIKNNIE